MPSVSPPPAEKFGHGSAPRGGARSSLVDDGGNAVVRVKPPGAGGGGGEESCLSGVSDSTTAHATTSRGGWPDHGMIRPPSGGGRTTTSVGVSVRPTGGISVNNKFFGYPKHTLCGDQTEVFQAFMPDRIDAFLDGVNVNMMAYGQTGSGKTHTMFGPPGLMGRAASQQVNPDDFGLCPRTVFAVLERLHQAEAEGRVEKWDLTASAVELSVLEGNLDMMVRSGVAEGTISPVGWRKGLAQTPGAQFFTFTFTRLVHEVGLSSDLSKRRIFGQTGASGVSLDKTANPPRLYGMTELPIRTHQDVQKLFAAIASRNTSGTGLNDTSSRSHCFVWLTLRVLFDKSMVRTSRLQFVDLAGSERLWDAHGSDATKGRLSQFDVRALEGLGTNYSLIMLSQCVRDLVGVSGVAGASGSVRGSGGQENLKQKINLARQKKFSFRAYIGDLVPLLSESLSGAAASLVVVCISSAPKNASQSVNTLAFGEIFANLAMEPVVQKAETIKGLKNRAHEQIHAAQVALESLSEKNVVNKFAVVRGAQLRDGETLLAALGRLEGGSGGGISSGADLGTTNVVLGFGERGTVDDEEQSKKWADDLVNKVQEGQGEQGARHDYDIIQQQESFGEVGTGLDVDADDDAVRGAIRARMQERETMLGAGRSG